VRITPIAVLFVASGLAAQEAQPTLRVREGAAPPSRDATTSTASASAERRLITVPAGTKVPLVLKHGISSKNSRAGNQVYASTSFPVAINDHIAIPSGTYVHGEISEVRRPGHVKGKAEILIHFTTLVFPNGYTVSLPGAVEGAPQTETGSGSGQIKDQEGTIQGEGNKAQKVGTIASTAGTGAVIGGVTNGGKGAAIGAGIGGAAGALITMLSRGPDLVLPPGTSLEMVFQRNVTLDEAKMKRAD